jgi:hypothetical protein
MRNKLKKYFHHENENFTLISHELNKHAKKQIAYEKASKGIEEEVSITVRFNISQFMTSLGNQFDNNVIDAYFKSASFKQQQGFKIEGNQISCTKTM